MLKALLKKQFLELNAFYFQDKKTGKIRSKKGVVKYVILFAVLFIMLGAIFFGLAMMFVPFLETSMAWIYYSIMGMIGVAYGTLGSVFNTYAALYHAKDNELLLSMPIPPSKILFVRVFGVAMMGLLYESMVMVPALIVRFIFAPITAAGAIFSCLLLLFLTAFITVLSCALGWLVALIVSKFKNKSILTVILSLAFLGAYYYFFSQSSVFIEKLLAQSEAVGKTIQSKLHLFYQMGRAAEGDPISMLIFCGIVTVLFLLTYYILSKTFIGITTRKTGEKKAVYKEKASQSRGQGYALFLREWRHFLSSPTYMLNCALGSVMALIAAAFLLIKSATIRDLLNALLADQKGFITVLVVSAVFMIASMNNLTAPSVSLEGKNIWIVQSLPVSAEKVLNAKQMLHYVMTMPPMLILAIVMGICLRINILELILVILLSLVFVMLFSAIGLALNLKMPNLQWKDETVAVKQSIAVLIAMFGAWVLSILVALAGFFALKVMSASLYLLICLVLATGATLFLNMWIKRRGTVLFEELNG